MVLEVTFGWDVTTMTSKFIAIQVTLSTGAPERLRHGKYASLPVAPPPSHSRGIGVALESLTPSLTASGSQRACASFLSLPLKEGERVRLRPSRPAAGFASQELQHPQGGQRSPPPEGPDSGAPGAFLNPLLSNGVAELSWPLGPCHSSSPHPPS